MRKSRFTEEQKVAIVHNILGHDRIAGGTRALLAVWGTVTAYPLIMGGAIVRSRSASADTHRR